MPTNTLAPTHVQATLAATTEICTAGVTTCAMCGAEYYATQYFGITPPCARCLVACRREESAAFTRQHQADRERAEHAARIERGRAAMGAPDKYATVTIEDFDVTAPDDPAASRLLTRKRDAALAYIRQFPDRGDPDACFPQVVVMMGGPGTGKTMMSIAMGHASIRAGATVLWTRTADLVANLRESWSGTGPSERSRLVVYRSADLLIIDELSRGALMNRPTTHLYDVVADREAELRPTIITTNDGIPGLASLIGAPLVSRIDGAGEVWDFGHRDYRRVLGARRRAR
jgi:DNA replication protein DnaC